MNRVSSAFSTGVLPLVTVPAWAQQATQPAAGASPTVAYEYGHHMWGGGWGWHPGMFLAPFVMLLALIGMVALIVWLVRAVSHGSYHHGQGSCPHSHHRHLYGPGSSRAALNILEERFARGEINKDEFEDRRRTIGR